MKKNLFILALGLVAVLPAKAQWNSWNTSSTISGVFGIANAAIESAERKKEMEIHAPQKVEFEQSFKDAMTDIANNWREVAKVNMSYQQINGEEWCKHDIRMNMQGQGMNINGYNGIQNQTSGND